MIEGGPYRLIDLNAWFPVGGTVWEGLGGVVCIRGSVSLGVGFEVS